MSAELTTPKNLPRLTFVEPRFIRWADGKWALIGPESALPLKKKIPVRRFDGEEVTVWVEEYIWVHDVHHRPGSVTRQLTGRAWTRYVAAR